MGQPESSGSSQQIAKRRKLNNVRNQLADGTRVPPISLEQTAAILKLDIDCFEEAFDYLRLKDLVSVSETCKRLHQVAGYCFQQTYLGSAVCEDNRRGIRSLQYGGTKFGVNNLLRFIQKIEIRSEGFQHFFDARSELRLLNQIHIRNLERADMDRMKKIYMGKLEVLRMEKCKLGENIHEILDQCVRLRHLSIENCKTNFDWSNRKYPTLEYLKLESLSSKLIRGIAMFLELNPNIRKFAITSITLWENRDQFMSANIKLDELAIEVHCFDIVEWKTICDLLNELHKRGFYRKLQLYLVGTSGIQNRELIDQLTNVNELIKVLFFFFSDPFALSPLKNLEEIYVDRSKYIADLEILPYNLINFKRIHFYAASIDDIMPLIKRSVKMQRIKVDILEGGVHFNENTKVIDLLTLNRTREQLTDAKKMTLYVTDRIYLATKWAMKGTDFGFIRLKRLSSYEWHHDFKI